MFSNTNSGFGNPPQPPQLQTGGLFGNLPTQQTNSTFGAPAAQPAPNTLAPPSFFGNPPSNNPSNPNPLNPNTQPSGGGLFGATSTQGTGGTNPLLGGSTTTQPAGGLFGSFNSNQSTAATNTGGTGIFGAAQPQQQQANFFGGGAPASFGNKPAGGLFASINTGAGSAPNPLFGGAQQPQQQNQVQPNAFGQFGQPQQQQQQQQRPLFGASLNQPGGNSLAQFSSQNSLFSSRNTTLPAQQRDIQMQFAALTQRIEAVIQAWNANSPLCRFQYYFYNLVDPKEVGLYVRPPNATNGALWEKAVRENPDPTCFVPVLAMGFDDLQQRINAQSQQATAHQEKLKELRQRITALTQRHEVSNAPRMQRAMALQAQLQHRVLALVQHLHLLIPAVRSSAIRPEEEALRDALEEIDEEIRKPGAAGGRMHGKLNELWALVGAVHAAKERGRKGMASGTGADGNVEWAVVDDDGLGQIAQILSEQQAGLGHLTKMLQRDLKDLGVIQGTGSSYRDDDHSNLQRSVGTVRTNTLR